MVRHSFLRHWPRLLCLMFAVVLSACSQSKRTTETKIIIGNMAGVNYTDGGVIFVGQGPNGTFVKNISDTSVTYKLATGGWNFRVVAWSGPSVMQGALRCANVNRILSKDQEIVSFTLNQSNCSALAFGDGLMRGAAGIFQPIKLHTCSDFTRDMLMMESLTGSPMDPKTINSCADEAGKERSFRVVIPSIDTPGTAISPTPPLISGCLSGMSNAAVSSGVIMPDLGTPVHVIGYTNDGCVGDQRLIEFDYGLRGYSMFLDGLARVSSGFTQVFLDSHWCSGAALSAAPFASGSWVTSPGRNIVCTANQLSTLVSTNGSYAASHVSSSSTIVLGNNIDLTGLNITLGDNAGAGGGMFAGTFDGDSYAVLNGSRSLFDRLQAASVFDLKLQAFNIVNSAAVDPKGILANSISPGGPVNLTGIHLLDVHLSSNVAGPGPLGAIVGKITDSSVNMKRIKLDQVDVADNFATPSSDGVGLVAGVIAMVGSSHMSMLEEIQINTANVKGDINIGGLVGKFNDGRAGNAEQLEIRNIQLTDVSVVGVTNVAGAVGGTVSNETGGARLILSDVSLTNVDPNIAAIEGKDFVAGMIGKSYWTKSQIRDVNHYGLIYGAPPTSPASVSYLGGVVGQMDQGSITNSHASVTIQTDEVNATGIQYVGGIAAQLGVVNVSGVKVDNVSALVDLQMLCTNAPCVANWIGGAIGLFSGGAPVSNDSIITASLIDGSISTRNSNNFSQTTLTNVGGIVGRLDYAKINKVISHMDVLGQNVGGAVGSMSLSNASTVDEVYVTGNVTFGNPITNGVGGLVGYAENQSHFINNSLYVGTIVDTTGTCNGGNQASLCGALIGVSGPSVSCSRISTDLGYFMSSTYSGSAKGVATAGAAACMDGTMVGIGRRGNFAGPLGEIFDASNQMIFVEKWKVFSPSLDVAGNNIYPFNLDSVSKWNAVATNPFLLTKSFQLGASIAFNNDFQPWGNTSVTPVPFTGTLYGHPDYELSNIVINGGDCAASTSDSCGMIRVVGEAGLTGKFGTVGTWDIPIKVDGITVNVGGTHSSIAAGIGVLENGMVSMRISNASVTSTSSQASQAVGGVVGTLNAGHVYSSSYNGAIDLATSATTIAAGGVIGRVSLAGAGIRGALGDSYSIIDIQGSTALGPSIGGLIGEINQSGDSNTGFNLSQSYTIVNGFGTAADSSKTSAMIGKITPTAGTIYLEQIVAIINTTEPGAADIGSNAGGGGSVIADVNTVVMIGDATAHPDNFGSAAATWQDFLLFNSIDFDLHGQLYFGDPAQRPRLSWEYPVGVYPNIMF